MKITNIETILAGQRYLFVKVHTDTGLVYPRNGAPPHRPRPAEHRIYQQWPDPLYAFPRLRGHGGDFRHRHCSVGFEGQILQRPHL